MATAMADNDELMSLILVMGFWQRR